MYRQLRAADSGKIQSGRYWARYPSLAHFSVPVKGRLHYGHGVDSPRSFACAMKREKGEKWVAEFCCLPITSATALRARFLRLRLSPFRSRTHDGNPRQHRLGCPNCRHGPAAVSARTVCRLYVRRVWRGLTDAAPEELCRGRIRRSSTSTRTTTMAAPRRLSVCKKLERGGVE